MLLCRLKHLPAPREMGEAQDIQHSQDMYRAHEERLRFPTGSC